MAIVFYITSSIRKLFDNVLDSISRYNVSRKLTYKPQLSNENRKDIIRGWIEKFFYSEDEETFDNYEDWIIPEFFMKKYKLDPLSNGNIWEVWVELLTELVYESTFNSDFIVKFHSLPSTENMDVFSYTLGENVCICIGENTNFFSSKLPVKENFIDSIISNVKDGIYPVSYREDFINKIWNYIVDESNNEYFFLVEDECFFIESLN